jgi:hypothetical protein
MAEVQVSQYLVRLGHPTVVEDPETGLKKITRRYRVDNTGCEADVIDTYVMDVYGNTDKEYTSAYLVDQQLEGNEDEGNLVLTRVFHELDASALTQYGDDLIEKDQNNQFTVTRIFLGLAEGPEDVSARQEEIGAETYYLREGAVGSNKVKTYLAQWKRETVSQTLVRYTKVYREAGVLRVDRNQKYAGAVTEITVTGFMIEPGDITTEILGVSPTEAPILYDTFKDNYEGLQTTKFRYVLGEGVISIDRSKKTGTEIVDEVTIVSVNITPTQAILDGYTYTFDPGGGDELVINTAWLAVAGLNSVNTNTRDDYIIYTARYVSVDGGAGYVGGSGAVSVASDWGNFVIPADSILTDQQSLVYDDELTVRRISFIIDATLAEADPDYKSIDGLIGNVTQAGDVVTDVKTTIYPGYAIGEITLANGEGVISVTEDVRFSDIRSGYPGAKVYQVKSIGIDPLTASPFDQGGTQYVFDDAKVIKSGTTDTQYGKTLYDMELFKGQAISSLSQTTRYDGALTLTTITGVNEDPQDFYGVTYGYVAEHETTVSEYGTHYKYVFASGQGEIDTKTETRYDGKLTITTLRYLNQKPPIPAGVAVISEELQNDQYGDVFTVRYAQGSGEISRRVETRYGGGFEIITVQSLNAPVQTPAGATILSEQTQDGDYGVIYTTKYATGSGVISLTQDTRYDGALTLTTISTLNIDPVSQFGAQYGTVVSQSTTVDDLGTTYKYIFASGQGEIDTQTETRYNGQLTISTVRYLNTKPPVPATAAVISEAVQNDQYGDIFTVKYAEGSGEISLRTDLRFNGNLQIITVQSLNAPVQVPVDSAILSDGTEDGTYGTVYTTKYASGSGLISTETETRFNGVLNIVTEKWLNADRVGSYPVNSKILEQNTEVADYGNLTTYKYAHGSGVLSTEDTEKFFDQSGNNVLDLRIITSLNEAPTTPAGYFLVKTQQDERDYGTAYIYEFASGSGVISESTTAKIYDQNGLPVVSSTTIVALNEVPATPAGGRLVDTKESTGDYGITYTYTFSVGSGFISETISYPYPNVPDIRVYDVRWANAQPPVEGRLLQTSVSDSDFATFYNVRYVVGSGKIGSSISYAYDNKITIYNEQFLNETGTPTGDNMSDIKTTSGTYGEITTIKSYSGGGVVEQSDIEIANGVYESHIISVNYQPSGNIIDQSVSSIEYGLMYKTTKIFANDRVIISDEINSTEYGGQQRVLVEVGDGDEIAGSKVPAGWFLTSMDSQQMNGWLKTTAIMFKPPDNYTESFKRTMFIPGVISADATTEKGYQVDTKAQNKEVSGTVQVSFSTTVPTIIDNIHLFQASSTVNVHVNGDTYIDKTVELDGYAAAGGGSSASYNNVAIAGGYTVSGQAIVTGPDPIAGSITLSQTAEPAYTYNGTTIYKITTVSVTV